jgi:hypothetical protein
MNEAVTISKIEKMIYVIRGQRVMLDSDLAELYEFETGALNRQVKRNAIRFPADFMFQLTQEETVSLRCQIGISKDGKGGRRYQPFVFTELGVAMLSSVLSSEKAALVNIAIMRTFVKLRSFLSMEASLSERVSKLESGTNHLFKIVFERLDAVEEKHSVFKEDRKKIGLKKD